MSKKSIYIGLAALILLVIWTLFASAKNEQKNTPSDTLQPTPTTTVSISISEEVTASTTPSVPVKKELSLLPPAPKGMVLGASTVNPLFLNTPSSRRRGSAPPSTNTPNSTATVTGPGSDVSAPIVSITDPISGQTLSHAVAVIASVSDQLLTNQIQSGVKEIQFFINNVAYGSVITATSSARIVVDTTSLTDGAHTIGATATDNAGNTSAISNVSVIVSNPGETQGPNMVLNPSVEDGLLDPDNWFRGYPWGDNTQTYTYPVPGNSGLKGVEVSVNSYNTTGDEKWYFKDISIIPNTVYNFSNFYKSNVPTRIAVRYTLGDNSNIYQTLIENIPAVSDWTKISTTFTPPAGSVSATVFHLIETVGTLTIDDASVTTVLQTPFNQGMVSLDFDDGWQSTYDNALPILNSHGIKSTQYIMSNYLGAPGYVDANEVIEMQTQGHEIGSHTKNHPELPTLLLFSQVVDEIDGSKTALESIGVKPIASIAYPYGAWNATTDQVVKDSKYIGARTAVIADGGFNYRNGNPFLIKTKSVESTTSVAAVKAWIDEAISNKTWLVLVFHQTEDGGGQYSITPSDLAQIADYITSTGVKTVTTSEGIYEMTHN